MPLGAANVHLSLKKLPRTNQWWAWVDFNPSKVSTPKPLHGRPLAEARAVAVEAWEVCCGVTSPLVSFEQVRVRRIDLHRIFWTSSPIGFLLNSLVYVPVTHARKQLIMGGSGAGPSTLLTKGGRASGLVRTYQQHEVHSWLDPDSLRWEVEARVDWCKRGNLRFFGDLNEERLARLALERWRWSGVGTRILTRHGLAQVAAEVRDKNGRPVSCQRQQSYIGYLVQKAAGLLPEVSPARLAEYRRWMRRHGVLRADGYQPDVREPLATWLDLATGRERKQVQGPPLLNQNT